MIDKIPNWPDWQVIEKIGEGSFGSVYKARRNLSGTDLFSAIKIVRIPNNRSEINSMMAEGKSKEDIAKYYEEMVADCLDEIKLSVSLRGVSNIVAIEDYQMIEDKEKLEWSIYIRMELLTSLIDYMKAHEMKEKDVVKLGIDICSALGYCEKEQIIHRDIKPENIFVSRHGNYKLGDFGIARQLNNRAGSLSAKGTFNYMAPEVYHGERYDMSIDTYSLALVLYKLVNSNQLPFVNELFGMPMYQATEEAIKQRMKGVPIPRPSNASPTLGDVLTTALQHNPQKRFRDAKALKNALIVVQEDEGLDPNETVAIRRPQRELTPNMANQSWNNVQRPVQATFDSPRGKSQILQMTIILAAVVIFVSAVALFILLRNDKDDSRESTNESTVTEETMETVESNKDDIAITEEAEQEPEELTVAIVKEKDVDLIGYERAKVATYGQTSVINQDGYNNTAAATLDANNETSWQEGKKGAGKGEKIWFDLVQNYEVEYLAFRLGNWRDDKYYKGNNRPKKLKIMLNEVLFEVEFPDKHETQFLELSHPYTTSRVEVEIVSVYKGEKWEDTCIAEVFILAKTAP